MGKDGLSVRQISSGLTRCMTKSVYSVACATKIYLATAATEQLIKGNIRRISSYTWLFAKEYRLICCPTIRSIANLPSYLILRVIW